MRTASPGVVALAPIDPRSLGVLWGIHNVHGIGGRL